VRSDLVAGSRSRRSASHSSLPDTIATPRRSRPSTAVAEQSGGAAIVDQLDVELDADGIHTAFGEMRNRLQGLVRRFGLLETLESTHLYPTIDRAIAGIREDTP
jgi:hypothetical protein